MQAYLSDLVEGFYSSDSRIAELARVKLLLLVNQHENSNNNLLAMGANWSLVEVLLCNFMFGSYNKMCYFALELLGKITFTKDVRNKLREWVANNDDINNLDCGLHSYSDISIKLKALLLVPYLNYEYKVYALKIIVDIFVALDHAGDFTVAKLIDKRARGALSREKFRQSIINCKLKEMLTNSEICQVIDLLDLQIFSADLAGKANKLLAEKAEGRAVVAAKVKKRKRGMH